VADEDVAWEDFAAGIMWFWFWFFFSLVKYRRIRFNDKLEFIVSRMFKYDAFT